MIPVAWGMGEIMRVISQRVNCTVRMVRRVPRVSVMRRQLQPLQQCRLQFLHPLLLIVLRTQDLIPAAMHAPAMRVLLSATTRAFLMRNIVRRLMETIPPLIPAATRVHAIRDIHGMLLGQAV